MATSVYRGELETLVSNGALLVDVREDEATDAIPGCTRIPLSRLGEMASKLVTGRPTVFYCRSGLLSYQAAQIVEAWTEAPVYYLSGGLLSARDA